MWRDHRLLTGCIVAMLAAPAHGQLSKLFTVSKNDDCLRIVDPATGTVHDCITLSLPGSVIQGATGLVRNADSGDLLGMLKIQGSASRRLVLVDPSTGVCTSIIDAGDRFAGLAYTNELLGVTGDGADVPETLYRFALPVGTPSVVTPLGAGTDGEAIAGDSENDLVYHASGIGPPGGAGKIFEVIEMANLRFTPITITGDPYGEAAALAPQQPGFFYLTDTEMRLTRISTTGDVTFLSQLDHVAKGLALMPFCASDTNNDGVVNVQDLLVMLGGWGPCPPPCPGDTNRDEIVDVGDLLQILGDWGVCDTLDQVPPSSPS